MNIYLIIKITYAQHPAYWISGLFTKKLDFKNLLISNFLKSTQKPFKSNIAITYGWVADGGKRIRLQFYY